MRTLLQRRAHGAGFIAIAAAMMALSAASVWGQTMPPPQPIPYTQDFSTLPWTSSAYPPGWQGWVVGTVSGTTPSPYSTTGPTADRNLTPNGDAAQTAGNAWNYNGKIGELNSGTSGDVALGLAISTTGYTNVIVNYDIMTIRNPFDGVSNTRINECSLQYRIGATGTWLTLPTAYTNNNVLQTGPVGNTTPQNLQHRNVGLPASCNNQPLVQLRWAQRQVSGAGSRPSFALDNIGITGTSNDEFDSFPNSAAQIVLNYPGGQVEQVGLVGPTNVVVHLGGLADTDANGREQVQTEMLSLSLTGVSSHLGPLTVHVRPSSSSPFQHTLGQIEENANTQSGRLDLPPFAPSGDATSFFDVFFEVNAGGQLYHNNIPKRMSGLIHHKPPLEGDRYDNTQVIDLLDENNNPTGIRILNALHIPEPPVERDTFPNSQMVVDIQTPSGIETVALGGPTRVNVGIGAISDSDNDGLEQVPTEMVQLTLTGYSPNLGPVVVKLRDPSLHPNQRTLGQIEEDANSQSARLDLPPFAPGGTASSFFDVFFEVDLPALALVLHNHDPKHVSGTLHYKPPAEGDTYEDPQFIPLYDQNEILTSYAITHGRHIPHPPIEHDHFSDSRAIVDLQGPLGNELVTLTGPTDVDVAIGNAYDSDNDGLDQVRTRMMNLTLTGNSVNYGPIVVTLRDPSLDPFLATNGEIEETVQQQPGRLDLPPFAPSGDGASFFDVFFEVNVQGQRFHNHDPKHLQSIIHRKPPAEGDTYESPTKILLYDQSEQLSPFSLGRVLHTPFPPPEVERDTFPNSQALVTLLYPDNFQEDVVLAGPTRVDAQIGTITDPDNDGREQIQTEMVELTLTGTSTRLGPVTVHLQQGPYPHPPQRTFGEIEEDANTQAGRLDLPPFAAGGTATSFFDVFFDVDAGGFRMHNHQPKRMQSTIRHKPPAEGDTYEYPQIIDLFDQNDNPTGLRILRARHIPKPPPPIEHDHFASSHAVIEIQGPGLYRVVALNGPTDVDVNLGGLSDPDNDGLEQVSTQMTNLDLTGVDRYGVQYRVRAPRTVHPMPTLGEIEEDANTQGGRLDLPPFAPGGTASSFFDVFFQVEILGTGFPGGPLRLHNHQPKRMSTHIRHKPPAPGDTYEDPLVIQLFDDNEQPTPYVIVRANHTPDVTGGVAVEPKVMPTRVAIDMIQPNPMQNSTTVFYGVPKTGRVDLVIYDSGGRVVRTLIKGTIDAGNHTAVWNGQTDRGKRAGNGIYFARLTSDGITAVRKMVVLR